MIIAVEGDSTQPGLGLSPDNRAHCGTCEYCVPYGCYCTIKRNAVGCRHDQRDRRSGVDAALSGLCLNQGQ